MNLNSLIRVDLIRDLSHPCPERYRLRESLLFCTVHIPQKLYAPEIYSQLDFTAQDPSVFETLASRILSPVQPMMELLFSYSYHCQTRQLTFQYPTILDAASVQDLSDHT
jgi:hypothetical protein